MINWIKDDLESTYQQLTFLGISCPHIGQLGKVLVGFPEDDLYVGRVGKVIEIGVLFVNLQFEDGETHLFYTTDVQRIKV